MQVYGRTSISEFMQDRIVYRGLQPFDPSLPRLEEIWSRTSLTEQVVPRKNEINYARVILQLLQTCRQQDGAAEITRLVFLGDTRLLDGTAFANLCRVSGWSGLAFIGSEDRQPAAVRVAAEGGDPPIYLSNRWAALEDFDRYCKAQGLAVGEGAAVVIDMDKTMVGGRGRNGQVIDGARMQAVEETVAGLLGSDFDLAAFRAVYEPLNQPEFHHFTTDNQDYLAYICLMLGAGLFDFDALVAKVRLGNMSTFQEFIDEVERRRGELGGALSEIHQEIYGCVRVGDPTPFKAFRRNEYLLTVGRFGCLDDAAPVEKMLAEEIVITQEVRQIAIEWRQRGALLFGLSDKPDEASLPAPAQAEQGYPALHRALTHAVGE